MGTDKEINKYLRRLKNGKGSIDELFYAVSGYVKFIAFKYVFDKSLVDDVVMNTFGRILDNIHTFDEQQNGKAWISKIAQNEAYTINKRERRHQYVSLDEVSDDVACTVDRNKDLEFMFDLDNALDKLDESDRQIFELHVIKNMTYQQIATKLGIHPTSVYRRYKQTVQKIVKEIL